MGRSSKTQAPRAPSVPAGKRSSRFFTTIVLLVVFFGLGVGFFFLLQQPPESEGGEGQQFVGTWRRMIDNQPEDYVLTVRKVAGDGSVEAAYFNPKEITVKQARIEREGNSTNLHVELEGSNYDGSFYDLHVVDAGTLAGKYHQGTGTTFDVKFMREAATQVSQ